MSFRHVFSPVGAGGGGGGGAVTSVNGATGVVVLTATDVSAQASDAGLTSFLATDTAANLLAYTTAANTWASTSFTSFGRSLVDDADAATARTTLGVVAGTTSTAGLVELATDGETASNVAVQGNDARLAAVATNLDDATNLAFYLAQS